MATRSGPHNNISSAVGRRGKISHAVIMHASRRANALIGPMSLDLVLFAVRTLHGRASLKYIVDNDVSCRTPTDVPGL